MVLVHVKSDKYNLNTESMTGLEVVVMSNYVPCNIYIINLLEAQGYKIKKRILYQDNKSAIK